jgi:hypothetical protein
MYVKLSESMQGNIKLKQGVYEYRIEHVGECKVKQQNVLVE